MKLSKDEIIKKANANCKDTLMETLQIEFVDAGDDYVIAKMPVTNKVHQPDGILHGGATVALAETVGSFASHIFLDTDAFFVRGIDISAKHVKSVRDGFVYAKASFVHIGRTMQIFNIDVTDDHDNLVSTCKLTTVSLPKEC
ncbi:PaaI family thioesterase [Flavobacteriaceae bacterium]|jgi:1,4-dihydroxy-2-naphthoyl-CoA hydrolase|nr:PaaI family thioesterase [Flavobacteriaceae bacterium]|tara:strand:- start:1066 stop:1491 length:426 start_codon:yes stop_codon:yes gene_type:complete